MQGPVGLWCSSPESWSQLLTVTCIVVCIFKQLENSTIRWLNTRLCMKYMMYESVELSAQSCLPWPLQSAPQSCVNLNTRIWGRSEPILHKKAFSNHSLAIPCFVHPLSDTLRVALPGADWVPKPWSALLDFPFATIWGSTRAMTVLVSRLPLVLNWRYCTRFWATTRDGLCSSWRPVSSMFWAVFLVYVATFEAFIKWRYIFNEKSVSSPPIQQQQQQNRSTKTASSWATSKHSKLLLRLIKFLQQLLKLARQIIRPRKDSIYATINFLLRTQNTYWRQASVCIPFSSGGRRVSSPVCSNYWTIKLHSAVVWERTAIVVSIMMYPISQFNAWRPTMCIVKIVSTVYCTCHMTSCSFKLSSHP